jgi:hypothetical protein
MLVSLIRTQAQGDQIFAFAAIVFFWEGCLRNTKIAQIVGPLLSAVKVSDKF